MVTPTVLSTPGHQADPPAGPVGRPAPGALPVLPPGLRIVGAADVARVIRTDRAGCLRVVADAYRMHQAGRTVNPHSGFLRFPDQPRDRIISLPAFLGGDRPTAGIKWIASFPGNVRSGRPRASAVLVLNDPGTGFPLAVLESSLISASRTAASAVLAAELAVGSRRARRVGFVGTGFIAGNVRRFFADLGWQIDEFLLYDSDSTAAATFGATLEQTTTARVVQAGSADEVLAGSDVIVLATVAGTPHIHDPDLIRHGPVVLHLSLRDLAPDVILSATNITDDVGHVLREGTSLHLAEEQLGHHEFVHGTIGDLLTGAAQLPPDGRAVIISPFGLGMLDLAVGRWVLDQVAATGGGLFIDDFFQATEEI